MKVKMNTTWASKSQNPVEGKRKRMTTTSPSSRVRKQKRSGRSSSPVCWKRSGKRRRKEEENRKGEFHDFRNLEGRTDRLSPIWTYTSKIHKIIQIEKHVLELALPRVYLEVFWRRRVEMGHRTEFKPWRSSQRRKMTWRGKDIPIANSRQHAHAAFIMSLLQQSYKISQKFPKTFFPKHFQNLSFPNFSKLFSQNTMPYFAESLLPTFPVPSFPWGTLIIMKVRQKGPLH